MGPIGRNQGRNQRKNVKEINSMCFIQKNDIIHLVNLQQFNIKD